MRPYPTGRPVRQGGVALITAIAVVAIAVSTAAFLAFDQQISIRGSHNLLAHDQAMEYVHAAEGLAQIALIEDAADGNVDSLDETWAQPASLPLSDQAMISGQIIDLQGRLNLNSLVNADGKINATALARLERLLARLELPPMLAAAIVDWIDPDREPYGMGGAEDDAYTRLDPPYLPANTWLVSVTELRLVAGIDEARYQRLAPYVSTLPEPTPININTAPPEVLQAIGIPEGVLGAVLDARADKPFESVDALFALSSLRELDIERAGLGVGSGYFGLYSQVRFANTDLSLFSLIRRDENGTLRVLRRRQELF